MAQVTVTINGRPYPMSCDDGEEEHVRELAGFIDGQVQTLVQDIGQVGEARLLLMAAMLISDELAKSYEERDALKAELAAAAGRISKLAVSLKTA